MLQRKKLMKSQYLPNLYNGASSFILFVSLLLGIQSGMTQPIEGQKGFYCDTSGNIPSTVYQNAKGEKEVWIKWVSDTFADYDPLTRCQQVSKRFEAYRRTHQLKYITVGSMNGQNVVCTARELNGVCEGLLFTLKPGQEPLTTLYRILDWLQGKASDPSLSESASAYIDVSDRIEYDGVPSKPTNLQ
jgi:hypothetical protein